MLTWVLHHLVAHVASCGHDTAPLRRLAGLRGRDLDDPDVRVPDGAAADAWRLAEATTGDGDIGLHMALALPAGALDLLEYAFRSSPTLEAALAQVARYGRVVNERAAVALAGDARAVTLTVESRSQAAPQRQRAEFTLAVLLRLARETTGRPLVPLEVRFSHAAPESLFEHHAFFRAPLRFERDANQLLFAREDAALPLRGADPALLGVVRRRLDRMLAQIPPADESTSARVKRALLASLARGEPTASAIARELGLSERTLQRRLRAEGTWFRGILDAVRGELATALLREPGIGIAEIAFFLGYSEPAAFHRSFRRWTGGTPLAYRRRFRAA